MELQFYLSALHFFFITGPLSPRTFPHVLLAVTFLTVSQRQQPVTASWTQTKLMRVEERSRALTGTRCWLRGVSCWYCMVNWSQFSSSWNKSVGAFYGFHTFVFKCVDPTVWAGKSFKAVECPGKWYTRVLLDCWEKKKEKKTQWCKSRIYTLMYSTCLRCQ